MSIPVTQEELIVRLRELQRLRADFVAKRTSMNAARPDINATRAERALYDERYQADHEAERELFGEALRFAEWAEKHDAAGQVAQHRVRAAEREQERIVELLTALEEGVSTTLAATDWSRDKRIELDTLSQAYANLPAIIRATILEKG